MKVILIIVIVSTALAGCASANKIILPSGQTGFTINCSGTAVSISKCYEKAGAVCPNGYDIISSHNQSGVMSNIDGSPLATSDKGMVIQCK
ncbi:hypothetical protein [Dasania marina]|mgnify:CR=1 FL=1|uniref:hypothetical protein n=1 Tax=Dasania marina TaxID=471499 RepID=UPI0030D778F6|tara:strand:+ start:77135 stop:77407 length:273 start_codon:yes stop_codon:yes gene_type:complete